MPTDKPKPDKPKRPPSPPRRKNRFNERELARAVRAALASGAERVGQAIGAERVEVDPATGVISIILTKPNKPGAAGNALDQWMKDKKDRDARPT